MDAWEREVRELHQFLERWLDGSLPDDDATFSRIESALAPGFTTLEPKGDVVDRTGLLEHLRPANGVSHRRITIENARLLDETSGRIVATYEEVHRRTDAEERRVSTVLFIKDAEGPNGLRWLHLHETIVD